MNGGNGDDSAAQLALIMFCQRPEEDPSGMLAYDPKRLSELVEAALDDAPKDDLFLHKVLEDYGWNPDNADFISHEDVDSIDLAALAVTLETKCSVPKFVGIKFCRECNNMLYPSANTMGTGLVYKCRMCHGVEQDARHNCIYVHRITHGSDDLVGVNRDLASDPTLSRADKICPECNATSAVCFQAQTHREKSNMELYYVCTECGHKWKD